MAKINNISLDNENNNNINDLKTSLKIRSRFYIFRSIMFTTVQTMLNKIINKILTIFFSFQNHLNPRCIPWIKSTVCICIQIEFAMKSSFVRKGEYIHFLFTKEDKRFKKY